MPGTQKPGEFQSKMYTFVGSGSLEVLFEVFMSLKQVKIDIFFVTMSSSSFSFSSLNPLTPGTLGGLQAFQAVESQYLAQFRLLVTFAPEDSCSELVLVLASLVEF